ncbi:MAG: thioredoxin-disulfide reductase [Lachnospiraceae bacterium]|nr:thioredoxin-disulfide reductase [Lachnospiraceae bacterium]MBQ9935639.1 thioredoxin-disulfide reductase [Lachnospiraceae bacterium]
MYDIVIVGAGTAGLSAAIYGVRAGKSVLVLEEKTYGGQIINTPEVENYPGIPKISGFEFATNLYNQAIDLGVEVKLEKVKTVEIIEKNNKNVITDSGEYICNSVILATGAKNRPLGVDREQQLIGAGISYCATCDGMFFRGKDVVVVGGGNTALEDANFLSNYCNRVHLIHRRDQFRGEEKLVERLRDKDNVEFVLNSRVIELKGQDMVEGVVLENVQDKSLKTLSCQGVFVAIGQMPDNERYSQLVELDNKGYIVAGEDCKTSAPGVFAAGDCRTKTVRQLTTAAADGAVAALAASEFIG